MPNILLRLFKYFLYVLAFVSIATLLILTTRTGNKIGYLYLSDKLSRKSNLEVKVLSVNLYDYPHVSTSLLIDDIYTFDLEQPGFSPNASPDSDCNPNWDCNGDPHAI